MKNLFLFFALASLLACSKQDQPAAEPEQCKTCVTVTVHTTFSGSWASHQDSDSTSQYVCGDDLIIMDGRTSTDTTFGMGDVPTNANYSHCGCK